MGELKCSECGYPIADVGHNPQCSHYSRATSTPSNEVVERPDEGSMRFLLGMVEADIGREGETASFMVRAGLLHDILKYAIAAMPTAGRVEELERLVEESLFHLRLDARAEDYHKRALTALQGDTK